MLNQALRIIFGTKQDRDIKLLKPILDQVNSLEPMMKKMTDDELKAQTPKLKKLYESADVLWSCADETYFLKLCVPGFK